MATKKKLLQAAAGSAGGGGLNVEDVFRTYLYDGNATSQTITNGIDLDGEGGMTWIKCRSFNTENYLFDTERGAGNYIRSNSSAGASTSSLYLNSFNSDGFSVSSSGEVNEGGRTYASWTFRKAPKFFDVVTYTGDGNNTRDVSHNLGAKPHAIFIKKTSGTEKWKAGITTSNYVLNLNTNESSDPTGGIPDVQSSTDTHFRLGFYTPGDNAAINASGHTYVAYLFASNNGDGDFGPTGDQDIIKCGTVGSGNQVINLGFEPQFVMFKRTDGVEDWLIQDTGRQHFGEYDSRVLYPNANYTEGEFGGGMYTPEPNGFRTYGFSGTHIYIAIRRGPMAEPEAGTDVFNSMSGSGGDPTFYAGFNPDMAIYRDKTGTNSNSFGTRLTGWKRMYTNLTNAENNEQGMTWDYEDEFGASNLGSNGIAWMWGRAPKYFDVVRYYGNAGSGRAIQHNLEAVPEMIWVKNRNNVADWAVYHKGANNGNYPQEYLGYLNSTNAFANVSMWADTAPTDTYFYINNYTQVNTSGEQYIALLFASYPGISKIGNYTGSGAANTQFIDCGFTTSARFILIRKESSGEWWVFDSRRGITSNATDSVLRLNNSTSQTTENTIFGGGGVEPDSSGFGVTSDDLNRINENYIFYAIA